MTKGLFHNYTLIYITIQDMHPFLFFGKACEDLRYHHTVVAAVVESKLCKYGRSSGRSSISCTTMLASLAQLNKHIVTYEC